MLQSQNMVSGNEVHNPASHNLKLFIFIWRALHNRSLFSRSPSLSQFHPAHATPNAYSLPPSASLVSIAVNPPTHSLPPSFPINEGISAMNPNAPPSFSFSIFHQPITVTPSTRSLAPPSPISPAMNPSALSPLLPPPSSSLAVTLSAHVSSAVTPPSSAATAQTILLNF